MRKGKTFSKRLVILTLSVAALSCAGFFTRDSVSLAKDCFNRSATANFDSLAYKSTDGGASWAHVVNVNNDFLAHQLNKIVVDPLNPSNIYLATNNGVFKSTLGGCTWKDRSGGLTERHVRDLAIDPRRSSNLYALTAKNSDLLGEASNKLFITVDGGNDWQTVSFDYDITCLAIDTVNPSTLYLGASNQNAVGIFKSTDNGRVFSFLKQQENARGVSIKYIAVDPETPSTLYYGSNGPNDSSAPRGLFKSTDGGTTFSVIRHANDSAITFSLLIDPQNRSTLYEASSSGLFKSTDGGGEWAAVLSDGSPVFAETLTIDPSNNLYAESRLAVGNNSPIPTMALIRSSDGGQTWRSTRWTGSISSVGFDPLNSSVIYDRGFVPVPDVTATAIVGKKIMVTGNFFHADAVMIVEGEKQNTRREPLDSGLVQLVSKKAARNIAPGQMVTVSVEEADGVVVSAYAFRPMN